MGRRYTVSVPRFFRLAAVLLCAPGAALAAALAPLPGRAPIQLTLAFPTTAVPAAVVPAAPFASAVAPLPAFTAPAAVSLAPAPAKAFAASWSAMPPAVAAALRGGDARAFWKACRDEGFAPPEGDDAQQSLLKEGADLVAADRLALARPAKTAAAPAAKRGSKIDDAAFARALSGRSVREGIFDDAGAKRAILRAAGYTHLYGAGGVRLTLEEASDARVGRVFASTLAAHRRRAGR